MSRAAIAIAGAGPLGLASALALARLDFAVTVFEARAADAPASDPRVLALSEASASALAHLGAWPADAATPITRIAVAQQGGRCQTDFSAHELRLPALGHVLPAAALTARLRACAERSGLPIRFATPITASRCEGTEIVLTPGKGEEARAALLVHCEGGISDTDGRRIRYGQHALLCRATPAQPHEGRAIELFTPHGPLALLPWENDYAVVWTVASSEREHWLAASDEAWLTALNGALGGRAELTALGARADHALDLRLRHALTAPRSVWLGNAAQTLHPVGGQGFNLALRDLLSLVEALRHTPDPGDAATLQAYARARRADRLLTVGLTDGLARLFTLPLPGLHGLREAGLTTFAALPPLRQLMSRHMIYGARVRP